MAALIFILFHIIIILRLASNMSASWGLSAGYAVVTSISYPCEDFKGGGH